jgi:hypothetical protein
MLAVSSSVLAFLIIFGTLDKYAPYSFLISAISVFVIYYFLLRPIAFRVEAIKPEEFNMSEEIIVKSYKGTQEKAMAAFRSDATKMASSGYSPTSQVWAPGAYGCGSFVLALILCFVIIGLIIFVYMLIVKPAGTLTVTYSRSPKPFSGSSEKEVVVSQVQKNFRLSKNGDDLGEFDIASIKLMIRTGKLSMDDLYYDEELGDWIALSQHKKL